MSTVILGVTVDDDGTVRVDAPPPCPRCGGRRGFKNLDINGSKVRVSVRCASCGHEEEGSN